MTQQGDDSEANGVQTLEDFREALLTKHIALLGEHFDCVQIIASAEQGQDGTARYSRGSGSYYGRYGTVRSWMVHADEEERVLAHPKPSDECDEGGW